VLESRGSGTKTVGGQERKVFGTKDTPELKSQATKSKVKGDVAQGGSQGKESRTKAAQPNLKDTDKFR